MSKRAGISVEAQDGSRRMSRGTSEKLTVTSADMCSVLQ